MVICFACDLHLQFFRGVLQYSVADWLVDQLKLKAPDCVVFAGDVTADGDAEIYNEFINKIKSVNIPFIYIPGNSDLRNSETYEQIFSNSSETLNIINGIKICALNDSKQVLIDEQIDVIESIDDCCVVFMHHPPENIKSENKQRLLNWLKNHKNTMLFYGHEHAYKVSEGRVSLPALDPDKAIGEPPCVLYYDTDTRAIEKAHFNCEKPNDLNQYFGISCYSVIDDVNFAIQQGLRHIELRPNAIKADEKTLTELILRWRELGNTCLSVHLPDVGYSFGKVEVDENYKKLIELAVKLNATRFTQHVPKVSLKVVENDQTALDKICTYIADVLKIVNYEYTLGVENMHMTSSDSVDERRFGYTPEETLIFMRALSEKCNCKVGINLDVGHARNNAPISKKYQLSTWYKMVGQYAVAYHVHQVIDTGKGIENHMPITDVYGKLVSYASFFKCWEEGVLSKAPIIFEMRPKGAYEITLKTFRDS